MAKNTLYMYVQVCMKRTWDDGDGNLSDERPVEVEETKQKGWNKHKCSDRTMDMKFQPFQEIMTDRPSDQPTDRRKDEFI